MVSLPLQAGNPYAILVCIGGSPAMAASGSVSQTNLDLAVVIFWLHRCATIGTAVSLADAIPIPDQFAVDCGEAFGALLKGPVES
jgi:hypothetical protein